MEVPRSELKSLDYGIILLTLATAIINFSRVFPSALFVLNGLGYLGLLAGLYLPLPGAALDRVRVLWALIGYTVVTILAWVFVGSRIPIAFVDKAIEVVLVVLLVLRARSSPTLGAGRSAPLPPHSGGAGRSAE